MPTKPYSRRLWLQTIAVLTGCYDSGKQLESRPPSANVLDTDGDRLVAGTYPVQASEAGARALQYPYGDVRRYGAIGDGVADDTPAIQAALDSAHAMASGEVYIPAGTYLVNKLNVPGNNIAIRGAGSGYGYNTSMTPRTTLKAKSKLTNLLNLAVDEAKGIGRSGCWIAGIRVDGDLKAQNGINMLDANVIDGCIVRGCLNAGLRLANYTNASRISRCGLVDNFGWGLLVEGSSTTTFSVLDSNISLNQAGGICLQAGVLPHFKSVVVESNSGPGLKIYRPNSMTGAIGGMAFDSVWLEDNGHASGSFTLEIDAQTRNESNAPWRIKFDNCRFNTGNAARKHMSIQCAKWVTFEDCQFDASTQSDTLNLGAEARFVAFIESAKATGVTGLSDAQLDAAVAAGTRCYWSDRETKRAVGGSGQPAFRNGWMNLGSGCPNATFWFDREGYVRLQGCIKSDTVDGAAFVLPVGYRPTTTLRFPVVSNAATGELEIQASGAVVPHARPNTIFSLNGISFPTG